MRRKPLEVPVQLAHQFKKQKHQDHWDLERNGWNKAGGGWLEHMRPRTNLVRTWSLFSLGGRVTQSRPAEWVTHLSRARMWGKRMQEGPRGTWAGADRLIRWHDGVRVLVPGPGCASDSFLLVRALISKPMQRLRVELSPTTINHQCSHASPTSTGWPRNWDFQMFVQFHPDLSSQNGRDRCAITGTTLNLT
jgi:hypothetical protein